METESLIRLGAFVGLFAVFALWEMSTPRRRLTARKSVRWFGNLGLVTLNTLLVPLLVPIAAMGMAKLAQEQGWGLFNNYSVPYLVAFVCTILALDFVIYLQHVMFHSVPILWRLHRVHHSDLDVDVTRIQFLESAGEQGETEGSQGSAGEAEEKVAVGSAQGTSAQGAAVTTDEEVPF